ncbi:hypothetical protein HQ520_01455 [bacterium]|nr:hypothetical protein [bacterium]
MSKRKENTSRLYKVTRRFLPLLLLGATCCVTTSFGQESVLKYLPSSAELSAGPAKADVLVVHSSFQRFGTWLPLHTGNAFDRRVLSGRKDGEKNTTIPAQAVVHMPRVGTWRVWVRCMRSRDNRPGFWFFDVRIGETYQERFSDEGIHEGYGWEDGGTVQLSAGDVSVELIDSSAQHARFEAILLTPDLDKRPSDNYEDLLATAEVFQPRYTDRAPIPPAWATSNAPPIAEERIENNRVRVGFFETPSGGRTIIQKQTLVCEQDRWYAAGARSDLFAWLVVGARSTTVAGDYDLSSDMWDSIVDGHNAPTAIRTPNIFDTGVVNWLVPTQMRRIDDQTIELTAECDLGRLVATWSLSPDAWEPRVQCRFTPARAGSYSLGMFAGPEKPLAEVDYVLCPKPYLGKYVPPVPVLVRENASPNACSLMTLPLASRVGDSAQATFGIVPDPASYPYHWATPMDSRFGLGIRGPQGGVQPWLFSPLPGRPEGHLNKGQTFTFSYRPLFQIGGWNDLFRHVTDDILAVRDVKKNYYCSLTDAIFNVQDLVMADWKFSGWSDRAMAFAYVELRFNSFNHSAPLALVENYLFTEDLDWYAKRTIPTLAFQVSRKGFMTLPGKENRWSYPPPPLSGGGGYPPSVNAGFYLMSQGRTPAFRAYGFPETLDPRYQDPERLPDVNPARYGYFFEDIYRYQLTQDPALLERARKGADAYIETKVKPTPTERISGTAFEIQVTAPNIPSLLSMYEITKEKKYLDAAEESTRKLLAHGTWVQPKVPDGNVLLSAEKLKKEQFIHDIQTYGYSFNGDTRMILGYREVDDHNVKDPLGVPMVRTEAFDRIQDETVPAWLLSRVGLNVEGDVNMIHGSFDPHFRAWQGANITMNCYAPDLVRLSQYTGDPFYETVARHETLGRSANYPGYYINHMSTIYMKPDYPYEGPDVTVKEYTHIPVYLAKLQDFLITQAWAWSDCCIEFPWVRQYGYCYFDNKVYGFAPGKFFDQDDMWIWLKRGLIQVDNVQIDWLGARKEGLFAAALMNEDDHPVEVTVSLGEAVTGKTSFAGSATTYDASGKRSTAPVRNSRLTLTVPAKGLVAFAIPSEAVHAPRFAGSSLVDVNGTDTGETAALPQGNGDFGTGYVLQIDPANYYAYTFLPYTPDEIQSAVLHYRIGEGEWKILPVDQYPFEKMVEVADPGADFTFRWEMKDKQGTTRSSTEKRLLPLAEETRQ